MKQSIFRAVLVALAVAPVTRAAYNSVTTTGYTYTQDFNGLPAAAASPFVNDSTIPGWFAYSGTSATPTTLNYGGASAGGTATGQLYSFGSSTSVGGVGDRALGSINQTATGDIRFGTVFVNNTGQTITGITINYDGEQWRVATDQDQAQSLNAQYRIFDAGTGSVAPAGFTSFNAGFTGPRVNTNPGTAFSVDGNDTPNRVAGLSKTETVSWAPGQELWIRFFDTDSTGVDHALAVDNFSFSVSVPEPTSALLGAGVLALCLRRRARA